MSLIYTGSGANGEKGGRFENWPIGHMYYSIGPRYKGRGGSLPLKIYLENLDVEVFDIFIFGFFILEDYFNLLVSIIELI